jgi:glycosyltransferase involved in cell wall biosynthesis
MDNYSAFTNNKISSNSICKKEKLLCDKANLIFTSSGGLYKKIIGYTSENKVKIIKNGTDFEMFNNYYNSDSNKKRPQELKIDHKIIGYFGGISNWFDVDLIFSLSRNFSDCEIVIIGPINNNDLVEKAQNINNITLTGARNYSDLPKYLFHYDVCIMPFIINDLIKDVNPVKLYEYLSMGKPVVAPFYDEISEFGDLIYLAISQQDFIDKVKLSLNETNNDWVKQIRIEFAKQNSWSSRVNSICKELVDLDISNVM